MDEDLDRTASLMTPAKLAQVKSAARAPVSPSAFLDQMAADVGHQHVARLSELRADLAAQAGASAAATIQPPLQRLAQALPSLDFGLLEQQKSWWAGVTGKGRSAGAEFAAQFEGVEQAAEALLKDIGAVHKQQQPHASAADRTLVEFDVEYKALDKSIGQGARWLQDMRNQLKSRAQAAADPQGQEQIRQDAARCEILVARLKVLRAAAGASQQVHQQARATAERRAALMQSVQQAVSRDLKAWRESLSSLAAAAAEGRAGKANLDGPREAHADLQKRVAQVLADCDQLRTAEAALLRDLAAMDEQLQGAA
ncbi:MAG TPA: toxic anion resistance protein [Ramlibacter sp.]|nr:toxic anion resistance protein [Ramlibacter sp.]